MLIKQKHLFNKEECDLIINLIKINPQNWHFKDRKFKSTAIDYSIETICIFDRLKSFVEMQTDIEFRKINKQIHFHKFVKGDWFGKHNDIRDRRLYAIGVLIPPSSGVSMINLFGFLCVESSNKTKNVST